MIALWIVLGVLVLGALLGVVSYNRFVSQKQLIKDSWANIDTELRRRYDLIPNLVETVKGYASHEREIFEEVARTRSMAAGATGSPAAQAAAEGPFVAALGKLFAVAENYPDLKANQNFLALQAELSNTEDRLQTARRFYNANVRQYNQRVQQFPSGVVARTFHFEAGGVLRGRGGAPGGGRPSRGLLGSGTRGRVRAEPPAPQAPAPPSAPATPAPPPEGTPPS